MPQQTFYEFFAGGGMARAGLGDAWRCLFANDFDAKKARSYSANWGEGDMRVGDVHQLVAADLPGVADLAWASFPCQDLSLAGAKAGLGGARSGAFFGFRDLVAGLHAEGRAPRLLVVENVVGALTSNNGRDFATLCRAFRDLGYVFGALVLDAADFTPQSRPRLFVVALRADLTPSRPHVAPAPGPSTPPQMLRAHDLLDDDLKDAWRWWSLPQPAARNRRLIDVMEDEPEGVSWHTPAQTQRLLALMAPVHRLKIEAARARGERCVGALYRRTRRDADGVKRQRAEVRFDGLAGCLRTPGGGSSRQFVMIVQGAEIRSRLLSPRECARLMGLPDDYVLPASYTDACHLLGDGVAPPVVRHLSEHLLLPLLGSAPGAGRSGRMSAEDPARRSATMRAVRGRDTKPELKVRALLRPFAPGYRLHRKDVPGKPDVAYVGARKAIFVHGCFWHGHDCPRGARAPKANADYWQTKIGRNRARDARHAEALTEQGWRSLTVWECELKDEEAVAARLRAFLAG